MTIAAAASTGDRRAALEAMRDKLARDMDDAPPAVVAQIAGRLAAILAEIDGLAVTGERDLADELKQRRLNRIAATKSAASAERSSKQRRKGSG
jgi:Na+(H+)/acetate symporter ActP